MATNHVWRLAAHPVGMVKESDFKLADEPIPALKEGEVLLKNLYLSLDPAMRGWITGRKTYVDGVQVGDIMRGGCVSEVVESKKSAFTKGDKVVGMTNWQAYCVTDGKQAMLRKIPEGIPLTLPLGPLGFTGMTAYFGLLDVGKPVAGETVVVSGAAGATGSVVGQIAKIKGCRVVGIAGGKDKCDWLTKVAGFDAAIDYKADNVRAKLKEHCPKGINVYFDNVGGDILEAALDNLAFKGRVVLCGGISQYNATELPPGPRNYLNLLIQRGRMEGFIIMDFLDRADQAIAELAGWVLSGQIKYQEDIQVGLENAPKTLIRLFESKNNGKQLLKIADPAS